MFQPTVATVSPQDRAVAGTLTVTLAVVGLVALRPDTPQIDPGPQMQLPPLVELIAHAPPPPGGGAPAPAASASPPPTRAAQVPLTASTMSVRASAAEPAAVVAEAERPEPVEKGSGNDRGTAQASSAGARSGPADSGPPGGGTGALGPGDPRGDGPVALPWNSVQVRRVVEPIYPRAAHDLGLPSTRCLARVHIDTRGRPTQVEVQGCSTVFHTETRRALLQWRFYPARKDGQRVSATFVVPLRFAPRHGP